MARVPPAIAHRIVLREMPRTLRAGLCDRYRRPKAARDLAGEVAALEPDLETALIAWIDRGCPAPFEEVARLHRLAAEKDEPALSDIGDALLMLGTPATDTDVARRLSRAAWGAVDRLSEVGARLHQLAAVSAAAQMDDEEDLEELEDAFVADPEVTLEDSFPAHVERRRAALAAWREAFGQAFDGLKVQARDLAIGMSILGDLPPSHSYDPTYCGTAAALGRSAVQPAEREAVRRERMRVEERAALVSPTKTAEPAEEEDVSSSDHASGVIVCRAVHAAGGIKAKEILRGYEHVVGQSVPLVATPDLARVHATLAAEFPYALPVVDLCLRRLASRPTVHLPPLLLVGQPGCGKTLFVRRLGEELGVGVHRTDGAGDAGATFGGTERRWHSSEPCRPLMAIAHHRHANPLMLIDEIDKSPTRSDFGRLWDALIGVLERETSSRYPDPAFQCDLDLSHVSFVCTANTASALPGPLLDRLTIVRFPGPTRAHMDALTPGLLTDIAAEQGLEPGFLPPLDNLERDVLRRRWSGGSVRRLRRLVQGVLRARDRVSPGRLH